MRRRPPPPDRRLVLPPRTGPPPTVSRTVTTDDGIDLHVEVDGPQDGGMDGNEPAPLTVVFAHGFTARLAELRLVQELIEETPLTVSIAFWSTFLGHDETAALSVLGRVPVTVVAATLDRLTPAAHGRLIAETLGQGCEFVLVPGAGRSVNLTRTEVVDRALLDLLDRVEEAGSRRAG